MRPGETISVATFFCFIVLGWLCRLERKRQYQIVGLGLLGTAVVLFERILSLPFPKTAAVMGDWLPAILILVAYWQSGRFFKAPNEKLQAWLEQFDRQWLGGLLSRWESYWSASWVGTYFELAYLLCYALIPLGVAVLYLAHRRPVVNVYWATVLPATFLCYLVIPFSPTIPPRLLHRCTHYPLSAIRSVNLFVLRHASIQLNTFPSAHVASTVGASLVLLWTVPAAGAVFLLVSLSIAAGAVLGRYHYLPDAILGALLSAAIATLTLGFFLR